MAAQRKVTVRLSPEAWEGWSAAARTHGVTITGLIEAIGVHLPSIELPDAVLELARDVDQERRRRR